MESLKLGNSNDYPQHMFLLKKKEDIYMTTPFI